MKIKHGKLSQFQPYKRQNLYVKLYNTRDGIFPISMMKTP